MPILPIVFWVFVVVVFIQLCYYLSFLFGYLSKKGPDLKPSAPKPLSLIICAKNEVENLKINIPEFLNQDYDNFELVLVNDGSSDDSLKVMSSFAQSHPNVKVVDVKNVESFWGNKKYALTLGIKASSHSYLVFSDADCKPSSRNWLKFISASFSKDKDIVIGYGAYRTIKGSFINLLIRFETLLTAVQYFSYARLGMPYMGVGRNLAYQKDVFFNNSGFMKHMKLSSGDDDLFINSVASKDNIMLIDHPEAHTISEPKKSFGAWFRQKRRHLTTSHYYKPVHKFLLGGFYCSQLLFLVLAVLLLSFLFNWEIVLGLIFMRYIVCAIVFYKAAERFKEKGLTVLFPILEAFLIISQFFIFSANIVSRPKHWS